MSRFKEQPILYNQPFLKQYVSSEGLVKYKLTVMKAVKNKNVDADSFSCSVHVNDEKLDNNLQRSRSTIFELAFCNSWDYFFTGTLDKNKCSRDDLTKFRSKFNDLIYRLSKKYTCNIKYLLIPELHSDGKSWHFHGFVSGLPTDRIYQFKIGDKMR